MFKSFEIVRLSGQHDKKKKKSISSAIDGGIFNIVIFWNHIIKKTKLQMLALCWYQRLRVTAMLPKAPSNQ